VCAEDRERRQNYRSEPGWPPGCPATDPEDQESGKGEGENQSTAISHFAPTAKAPPIQGQPPMRRPRWRAGFPTRGSASRKSSRAAGSRLRNSRRIGAPINEVAVGCYPVTRVPLPKNRSSGVRADSRPERSSRGRRRESSPWKRRIRGQASRAQPSRRIPQEWPVPNRAEGKACISGPPKT